MKCEVDTIDESVVTLDTYNSDLNLVIDGSKYNAQALTKEGFAFMWAGARATHGVKSGKVCFEVKVLEHLDVSHLPSDEPNPHVVRVGFSVDSSTLQLGEDPQSYGYGGTGKISTNCQFKDFGPAFRAGDTILAVLNMDSDQVEIGFAKNGNFVGWAYKVKKAELKGKPLFPHILTKNCSFEVNFGQKEQPFYMLPDTLSGFVFIGCLPMDQRIAGTRPPIKREDCEMIMMCGLPGCGKSYWAAEYSSKNPEKKYNVLGTNNIIDKMKVMGLPRKRNYHGRWDVLIQMATKCLNVMFSVGSKLRRNYILDQTNVYPTAQRRKMRNFDGFKRKAVVIVPTEEEFKRRCDKRDKEEGKEIPDSAVLEMKANFKMPEENDIFDEVIFTDLQRDDAEKLVKKYNEEGKAAVGPARKQFRSGEASRFEPQRGSYKHDDSFEAKRDSRFQDRSKNDQRGSFSNRGGRDRRDAFDNRRGGFGEKGRYSDSPRNFGGRFDDGGRGGFDRNREEFDFRNEGSRGGFDGNREEFDFRNEGGRGNFGGNRGEFGNFRSGGNEFGGYDQRGFGESEGFDQGANPYNERDSYERFPNRESYGGMSRGNNDSGRGRGRGGFDGRRGTFDASKNSGRSGNMGARQGYQDYDESGGQFEQGQEKYGRGYGNENTRNYQSYSNAPKYNEGTQADYRQGSSGFGGRGGSRGGYSASDRGNYNTAEYSSYSEQKAPERNQSGNASGNRGSYNNRYQHGNRGGNSRGNYRNYSSAGDSGSNDAQSSDKSYGYTSSGGYGESNKYQNSSTSYMSSYSSTQPSYPSGSQNMARNTSQWSGATNVDASNKFASGSTRSSGGQSRMSAETSQAPAPASDSNFPTYKSTSDTYSTGGSQNYTYPQNFGQSSQPTTSYQSNQAYGYQQGVSTSVPSQQWPGASAAAAVPNPSTYSMPSQSTWSQYGQQQQQPPAAASYQYYSQ